MNNKIHFLATVSLLLSRSVYADELSPDCSRLQEEYENAMRYANARDMYGSTTAKLLNALHTKCKNEASQSPENKTAFALTTYRLGKAFWQGYGVPQDCNQGCSYFNEILRDYPDITKEEIVSWSNYFVGDGALNGVCEPRSAVRAKPYYEEAIKNAKNPNLIAWSKARLGDIYRQGNGIQPDPVKSIQFFEEVLNDDENITDKSVVAWAKFWIADAHEFGSGKPKDIEKAYNIFIGITTEYENSDPIAVDHAHMRLQKIRDAGYVPNKK